MEVIGLTTKCTKNKYASGRDGELMLIHRCIGCDALVINRIAADDSAAAILDIFDDSCTTSLLMPDDLDRSGVSMLLAPDRDQVWRQLFGERLVYSEEG